MSGLQAFLKERKEVSVLLKEQQRYYSSLHQPFGGYKVTQTCENIKRVVVMVSEQGHPQHLPVKLNVNNNIMSCHLRNRNDWILDPVISSCMN